MSMEELLQIEPLELEFAFELRKQISCSMQLTNKHDDYIAFKVKTTNPKKYCVRPNTGIVLPHSSCDVTVTMQAQKEAPTELQCKDKFLVQCVKVPPGTTAKDITTNMFNKEEGHIVEESKLKVTYIPPPQPPSPVHEGSEEGSSPRASLSDNGTVLVPELNTRTPSVTETAAPRSRVDLQGVKSTTELQDYSSEAKALIAKLTEEKNLALQQKNRLQQEVDLLRRESSKNQAGIPFMYVIIVGLIGLLLGYILKK